MNIHKNARTTPYSRAEIVRRVMVLREIPRAVATALGVSERTVANWLARYRTEGDVGLALAAYSGSCFARLSKGNFRV